jgi:pimeloyl-ACP methyl ester carboxylesterase
MTTVQSSSRAGMYADAGGLRTYYEVHGEGEPLVLLHGGLSTVETLDPMTVALAQQYRVYLPERRGHGRTPDVDGPITFQNMAADTAALLDTLGVRAAHLVGFSDGGNVALQVALDRPDLVAKLVVMGAGTQADGHRPEIIDAYQRWKGKPSPPIMAGFKQLYGAVSPDGPEHFEVVFAKTGELWQNWTLSWDELGRVTAPTLILLADEDVLTIEHAAAIAARYPTPNWPWSPVHPTPSRSKSRTWSTASSSNSSPQTRCPA